MIRLREADLINPQAEAHYAFHSYFSAISTRPHCHDFYELFLLHSGSVRHHVNDQEQSLTAGALVFIRPDDRHYYQQIGQQDCQLLNLAFPERTLRALVDYLGPDFRPQRLLEAPLPPLAWLSEGEKEGLRKQLEAWNQTRLSAPLQGRLELRTLLAGIFTRCFPAEAPPHQRTGIGWLDELCQAMRQPSRFTGGVMEMYALAGKSPEHLARSFQRHLQTTPTAFVNGLRLDYAAALLTDSDRAILDIAFEAGFENLSHFYRLFNQRFGLSPRRYRQTYRRSAIP